MSKICNKDLERERQNADFDTAELVVFLNGGQKLHDLKQDILQLAEAEPLIHSSHKWFDMTREEKLEVMYKRAERLH